MASTPLDATRDVGSAAEEPGPSHVGPLSFSSSSSSFSTSTPPTAASRLPATSGANTNITTTTSPSSGSSSLLRQGGGRLSTRGPVAAVVRNGLRARSSLGSSNSAPCEPFAIPPVDGITSFYPQSLWVEAKDGKMDHDHLSAKSTYRLPAHKRLVAGKYVEDPDLKDFSNPRYRAPGRSPSQGGPSRLSRLGEFLGTSSPHPAVRGPSSSHSPVGGGRAAPASPPVYAAPAGTHRPQGVGSTTPPTSHSVTARTSTSGSFSTVGTSDEEEGEDDEAESDGSRFEECEDADEGGAEDGHALPPIHWRQQNASHSGGGGAGGGSPSVVNGGSSSRHPVTVVKQTYPVVEPAYPVSAASFYFPIYYGRPSAYERADPRGLPQRINEEFHPNDRANLPLSSVSVQKDNLNRMGLFKIGPGAVAFKVVICAFEAAGMKYTTSNSKFNILWAKRATPYTLASLTPYQKVNHFPGTWGIGRKDSLAQNVTKMRRYFGEAVFDIVPASFLLPRQEYELKADAERNPGTPEKPLVYILKPTASSCGRGIELSRGVPPMPRGGKQMVCQRYIGNPLLIFGRKFDLRLYCVVTSFDPLRVYIFDEGLVRFAAEKYTGPDQDLENVHKHLTNYSVNKTAELTRQSSGKDYDSEDPLDIKWCLSDFKRHLVLHHPLGLEAWTKIQRECDDVVIKALLSIENDVIERVRYECKDKTGRNCFELFGLDLMADEDLKVRLIEANIMPSLATASNLDKAVKARMLAHMLTLVRAMPYRRNALPKADRGRPFLQRLARGPSAPAPAPPLSPPQQQPHDSPQPRSRSTRSTPRGTSRSASQTSRKSTRGEGQKAAVPTPRLNEQEEHGSSAAGSASAPRGRPGSLSFESAAPRTGGKFVPHGAEADRPERTYRFGKHPMASARIVDRALLSTFNDPHDPESMLTPYETLMLVESAEELRCAGGFRRVFPVAATMHNYLPLFTHGVRRNTFVLCSAVRMQDTQKPKQD